LLLFLLLGARTRPFQSQNENIIIANRDDTVLQAF